MDLFHEGEELTVSILTSGEVRLETAGAVWSTSLRFFSDISACPSNTPATNGDLGPETEKALLTVTGSAGMYIFHLILLFEH